MKKIIILGAGASGIFTAISAALNNKNLEIIILEKENKPLKKLLTTGNGKCNYSNSNIDINLYNNPEFVKNAFAQFNNLDTIDFFNKQGIFTYTDNEGRCYPNSQSSKTIYNILLKQCEKLNIKIICNCEILKIKFQNNQYIVSTNDKNFTCNKLVYAIGSKSRVKNYNSLLPKHNFINFTPSLCPLKTSKQAVKGLKGVKVKAEVNLSQNDKSIFKEYGEVAFKDEGLTGIVIFNASLHYARLNDKKNTQIKLNLFHNKDIIKYYKTLNLNIKDFLLSLLNEKLAIFIYNKYKTEEKILKALTNLSFNIVDTYDFQNSQISVGGIDTNEVENKTLESKKYPHLFISGEVLNIDSPCGGYNLQWAWSSGYVIGKNILN